MIFYTNALPIYRQELYGRFKQEGWSFVVGNYREDSEVLFGLKNLSPTSCRTVSWRRVKFTTFPFFYDANKVLLNLDRSDLGFWLLLMRYLLFNHRIDIFVWGHISYEKDSEVTRYVLRKLFSRVKFVFSYGSHPIKSLDLKNIVQVYNGVSWERPAFQPAVRLRSKLVYVGRNSAVKKLEKLIQ